MRLLWALLLGLASCDSGPDVGDDRPQGGGGGTSAPANCDLADSDPDQTVSWRQVKEDVLVTGCSCHTTPGGLGQVSSGLDLSTRDSVLEGGRSGPAVEPGDPCNSLVIQKTSSDPPFGSQMPLYGGGMPADRRQLVIDWIAEGALP